MLKRGFLLLAWLFILPAPSHAAVFYPTSFTLANGLQVIVVPNHLSPAVNQMVWYKVGSADERPGETGLAHYLEHLMFRGTSTIPPGDFSKMIAAQGGNDNAFTTYDYTAYHETVAADRLPLIMQMEADRMQNLQITQDTAGPELNVVLDERQQRTDNDPQGRFNEKLRHMLMPHYPYGTPVIGWKSEIEKLTTGEAEAFYHAHYAPNNAIVIISGDVDPDEVARLATSIYGPIPKRFIPPRRAFGGLPLPTKDRLVMTDAGIEQPQMEMNFVVPSYSTQKDHEAYAYEVLTEALDDGEVGILYRKLAMEQGLASAIEASYDPDARGPAVLTIAMTPRPGIDPAKLSKVAQDQLKDLAAHGLDDKDIANAKDRLMRSAIFARDSITTAGYVFGSALATGHSVADVEAWPDRIKAVTDDDVNAALRDLVANPHNLLAMLLPDPHATAAQREAAQSMISHDKGIR